jgi:hypothetical protein
MLHSTRPMASELETLRGWIRPYQVLKNAVVVLGRSLGAPLKHALIMSGPALPLEVRLSEPAGDGAQCTRRIIVEPDDSIAGDESVRVRLVDPEAEGDAAQERTIAWHGDERVAATKVITAIRELAGLDAA